MPKKPVAKPKQMQFHRGQIGRAQRYIRTHVTENVTLDNIAKEAGASAFHFARIFQGYTGETPFEFLRRLRLATALRMLQEDSEAPVTEIALDVGYETASAFNKVFKKNLDLSPGDFRKLGKAKQDKLIYDLNQPSNKEINVSFTLKYDVVQRPSTHYLYLEKRGMFSEVAPPAWFEMFPLLGDQRQNAVEFLGLSGMDKEKKGDEAMIYDAGIALKAKPAKVPKGLQYREIPKGNYARFLLKGPYAELWTAFREIFKYMAENKIELREEFCIENYLNDPNVTPEPELLTEILMPIK